MPNISVILSVYNGSAFIKDAVRSILDQTYSDFEFIIIDDGCTDNTCTILESFDDPRIRILKNSTNRGLLYSVNLGISEAKGQFIARMDADDISVKNRLQLQYDLMMANPEIIVSGGSTRYFGHQNKTIPSVQNFLFTLLDSPFSNASVMIRKSFLDTHQIMYWEKHYIEDWVMFMEIYKACSYKNVVFYNFDEVLLHYRTHENQFSFKNKSKALPLLTSHRIRNIIEFFEWNNIEINKPRDVRSFISVIEKNIQEIKEKLQLKYSFDEVNEFLSYLLHRLYLSLDDPTFKDIVKIIFLNLPPKGKFNSLKVKMLLKFLHLRTYLPYFHNQYFILSDQY